MLVKTEKEFQAEPSPRWVRVKFGGEIIANSKNTQLVWDSHIIPAYFFPRENVKEEYLQPTGHSRGKRTNYHVNVGDRTANNGAWSYTKPDDEREVIKDYITFRWNKMDAWFEEDEQVFVHARDPYKRVDTIHSTRHIKVLINDKVIADTKRPVLLFETNLPTRYYIPQEDVRMDLLQRTKTHTSCPYKGTASYWSVRINDKVHQDLVWSYPDPIPEIPKIKGLLSFFNEKLDIYVDGDLEERPKTPWS